MRYEPEGLARWANTDPSLHVNVIHEADRSVWKSQYVELLKAGDYDAARQLRRVHDRAYRKEQR
jgi:hypothetical protein